MHDIETLVEQSLPATTATQGTITLQTAIEMGEYDPKKLATYAQWHSLSRHMQFQLIRRALDNRFRILMQQWAAIANVPHFTQKPQLQAALRNIEAQQETLQIDKEKLYLEYSSV